MPQKQFGYDFPVGKLYITADENFVVRISPVMDDVNFEETQIIKEVKHQLEEYFAGKRKNFDLPLTLCGSEFQKRVWNVLREIPYGETHSYKDVAVAVGNEKACRAVGMANNKNPILIVIPCHRVVGTNGDLVGYACGLEMKRHLLELEKAISNNRQKFLR